MDCSTPGHPVLHCLLKFAQTHVHYVSDAIQPSHPLLPSSPPALIRAFPSIRVFSNDLKVSSGSLPHHPASSCLDPDRLYLLDQSGRCFPPKTTGLASQSRRVCPPQTLRRSQESWNLLQTPEPLRSSTEGIPESRNFRRVHLNAVLLILKDLPGISYLTADARSR